MTVSDAPTSAVSPVSASTAQATPPADFSAGRLPLAAYDRTHKLQPATSTLGRLSEQFVDWFEDVIARFSVHGDPPVYRSELFPWVKEVESRSALVRAELDAVMQYRDSMPSFQDIVKEVGLIQSDNDWKTFFLRGVGMDCSENARRCPETMKVLDMIPGVTTAFFSILSPGKHIPHHRGPWAGILRLHVGLLVPEPRDRVRIRIANQICHWKEGECLIFDDTWNHEVWNDTEGYRVVLFIDFARPLRWPFNWINDLLLNLAPLAPFLREAKGKQKAWELKMWGGKKA